MPRTETVRRRASPKALVPWLAAVLLLPGRALAGDSEGRRIMAEIGEQYLEPATARQVHELLALENATTLAAVSTWADDIRAQRPETARRRYVNIPIDPPAGIPPAYDTAHDCPTGDCVVAAIGPFEAAAPAARGAEIQRASPWRYQPAASLCR